MSKELIDLPKKRVNKFFDPESQDLILSIAAVGTVFTFWDAINIRPSLLTDPGYQEQKNGITRHMNLSFLVICGMALAFSLIYKKKGYIPALSAVGTGVMMYIWTSSELNRVRSEKEYITETTTPVLPPVQATSVLYQPSGYTTILSIPQKTRREHATI